MEAICIYCFHHGWALYVSFLPLANTRGKTSWHKGPTRGKNNIYIWLPWIISWTI